MKQIIDEFIRDSIVGGFEDRIGAKLKHLLHLVLGQCLILLRWSLLLDDQTIPFQLDHLPFNNLLLNSILRDQPIDPYFLLLANSVSSIHGLQVHLRIEITIVDDNCISTRQVDAEASCSGAQEEDEVLIGGHEGLDLAVSALHVCASVDAAIPEGS